MVEARPAVAIVTGASRGIGAATARLLALKGYAVTVNYHSSHEKAHGLVEEIRAHNGRAIAAQGDMGTESDILRVFEATDKALGPVTALVNNAAINPRYGSGGVEEMPWDLVESVMRTNVTGVFIACREAVRRMKGYGGSIVNVSSESGRFGGNKMAHYAASKAAINTFTLAFAREAADYNIRVNGVSPGIIDTDAHMGASPARLASLKASLPMGRMGTPDEVAHTIAWLLSDAASYVSGSMLSVTGAR